MALNRRALAALPKSQRAGATRPARTITVPGAMAPNATAPNAVRTPPDNADAEAARDNDNDNDAATD